MSTIVENTNPISVEIEHKHSVTSQTGAIVEIIEPDYSVAVQRKEYKVVGDNIYIPRLYDDAPQWMKDIIGTVVDAKTAVAVGNFDDAIEAIRTLAAELEVAKNTYTLSIVSSNDINTRINTAIETLNSALLDADATILNIAQTATTPEEASAIAINTLSASLSEDGEIGSFISNMNSAFADLDSATTESINLMESAIDAEFSANATAVQTIRTYVGIDDAGASTGTGLSAYLEDSNGVIGGADSQLNNTIKVTAEGIESKFEYNSVVNINGIYKKSGFGLTTNYTSGNGTQANPYVSEFWIDASRLKFTNSNQTGRVAPFTIDATGATPQITFNGIVEFSNVNNVPTINKTYVQATQPTTGMNLGDTWIDTDDNNSLYSYNGTTWNKTQSGNKTFLQTSAPTSGMIAGDIWVDRDNNYKQYRYSGSAWDEYLYNPATAINTNTTTIEGSKITTGSIAADKIITTGLIAENISADEIIGKTITGGVINGARINGAVIKASYLDLNGDLEVLTNYIITVAMYNANPSLYTDAVYISADNQYRIPTLSVVSEPFKNYTSLALNASVYGTLRPYNSANVGHNLKAVKIRPVFQNTPAEFLILNTGYTSEFSAVAAEIYVDNSLIGTFRCGIDIDYQGGNDGFFSFTGPYVNYSQGINNQNHTQVDITGIPVLGTVRCTGSVIDIGTYPDWGGAYYVWKMSLLGGDGGVLPFNWTGGVISIKRVSGNTGEYTEGGAAASVQARLNGISINNMI